MDAADPVTVRGRSFFVALARKRETSKASVSLIPRPDPFRRVTRLAARRYEPNTCPVRSRVDRVLGRRRAWPVEVAPAGTENEIDDPNPTVNTTIRGGSTTATRRLSAAAKGPGEAVTSSYAV